jgi:hypothetical protein
MDIVYKKGGGNHVDAPSRGLDMKESLYKLHVLRDWTDQRRGGMGVTSVIVFHGVPVTS